VYAIEAVTQMGLYHGVANIGSRPTLQGKKEQLEAHFFDFNGDLYGQQIEVILKQKIRPERRFDGLAQLQQQIALDAQQARDYFALPPA